MRYAVAAVVGPLFASAALAQGNINATKLSELSGALSALGLDTLAGYAASIANSSTGIQLLSQLTTSNDNFTIFAPTNDALSKADKDVLNNPDKLAAVISYHVVRGAFLNETYFFTSPNNTILPTLLNDTSSTHLQGNQSQVLIASVQDGKISLLNQGSNSIHVSKTSNVSNFDILQIDGILSPPGSLSSVAKSANLNMFAQALSLAGLDDAVSNAHGITIFAPTDDALSAALAKLGGQASNQTLIKTVIQNHIINGTSIYSQQFDDDYTSAAGEPLKFNIANNTITIVSGDDKSNFTANVTKRDLIASNGVIHVIDAVLTNTNHDDDAASSAYSSATDAATDAASQTPTGAVGGQPTDSPDGAAPRGASVQWTVLLGTAVLGLALGVSSV
ncbi:FAS1 domain-containing protein [Exidia glandulosa HHB12029]|uniref:FAS1 domain-containing protein n=1 Tax=Exidia glandulosa HHB12029 TaxID=1314781 RepID=A0A165CF66_EXIGL|nr:FAS1 domain-containing protein [Exidia glandulosa HHB12029]